MLPPPCNLDKGPNDWTPYKNRLQFEVADFLFRRNQMSAGDINFILSLWAASLVIHDDEPPFSNATELYGTIDQTPLGDVAWESFSLQYNGLQPAENTPPWMEAEYNVWFRDPHTLVHNLLSNPGFKSSFDYAPYQEHTAEGLHHFQDFMSGNWAWNQVVGLCFSLCGQVLILNTRISLLRIQKPTALSFAPLSLVVIKLLCLLLQNTMNIGPSILPSQNVSVMVYHSIFVDVFVSFSIS